MGGRRQSESKIDQYAERIRHMLKDVKLVGGKATTPRADDAGDDMVDGAHQGHGMVAVREAMHRGKRIEIRTHYEITIDGESLQTHVDVQNNGSVHCHGLPNYAFASMVDMVKQLIDASVTELPEDEIRQRREEN